MIMISHSSLLLAELIIPEDVTARSVDFSSTTVSRLFHTFQTPGIHQQS